MNIEILLGVAILVLLVYVGMRIVDVCWWLYISRDLYKPWTRHLAGYALVAGILSGWLLTALALFVVVCDLFGV